MDNNQNQPVDPSQYLASISPETPNQSPENAPKKPKPYLLIFCIAVAICLGIAVVVLSIINLSSQGSTPTETADDNSEESVTPYGFDPLPELDGDYEAIGDYSDDLILAVRKSDDKTVVLDNQNNVIGEIDGAKYALSDYYFHDGLVPVRCLNETPELEGTKYGYLDTKGNLAIDCVYSIANRFENGEARVSINEPIFDESGNKTDNIKVTQGLINTKGELIDSNEEVINSSMDEYLVQ